MVFLASNEPFQRGMQGISNALARRSDLNAAAMQQGEMQRFIANRNELEQLLMQTPPELQERAAYS